MCASSMIACVELRRHLLDGAAAVVHPGLDQCHVARHQFLHRGAGARHRRDRKRRLPHVVGADLVERREPAARRQEPGGIRVLAGENLVAELKRHLAEVRAHRLAGRDAEIREAAHVVEDVVARVVLRAARQVLHVADVRVAVDQRGNDRLAGQIDARGAGGRLNLAAASDPRERRALDEKGRVLDRRAAVAGDQARAFEQGDRRGPRRPLRGGLCEPRGDEHADDMSRSQLSHEKPLHVSAFRQRTTRPASRPIDDLHDTPAASGAGFRPRPPIISLCGTVNPKASKRATQSRSVRL